MKRRRMKSHRLPQTLFLFSMVGIAQAFLPQSSVCSSGLSTPPLSASRLLSASSSADLEVTATAEKESGDHAEKEPCNVVFTHTNADFDSLAAAVALALLWKHEKPDIPTHVVLPRGVNPVVLRFLAFHKHLLPLRGFKTIMPEDVHAIGVVDAQSANRIGRGKSWLAHAESISIFDHHDCDDDKKKTSKDSNEPVVKKKKDELMERATETVIDVVGSTTTLLVERLREAGISPAPHEATLFVLGIRADTGGLVYEGTTIRDARALLWCLENGASQVAISEFGVAKVTEEQRAVLNEALARTQTKTVNGLRISSVLVNPSADQYVSGLAQVCEEIKELTDSDVYIMGATHRSGSGKGSKKKNKKESTQWISLIGRASARSAGLDLNNVMKKFNGGGHPKAAAASVTCKSPDMDSEDSVSDDLVESANQGLLDAEEVLDLALSLVEKQIPEQRIAATFMKPRTKVFTVNVENTVAEARKIFDENGLRSAPVVDDMNRFMSSLKLNDLVKASRAGRTEDKLKGMLRPSVRTVLPETTVADLEDLLINEGVGRIPVVDDDGFFLGLVTRTDLLMQHKLYDESNLDLTRKYRK